MLYSIIAYYPEFFSIFTNCFYLGDFIFKMSISPREKIRYAFLKRQSIHIPLQQAYYYILADHYMRVVWNTVCIHKEEFIMKHNTVKNSYRLWNLAVPIAFESFFQMMFGLADTFVLSSYSDEAVAAVGYVNQVLDVILLLFRVIASGTSILLAQAIGSRDQKLQEQICSAACWLSIGTGLLTLLGTVFGRTALLKTLQMDSMLLPHGTAYLQVMGCGLIFSSLFTVLTAIYRSSGKASTTSMIAISANMVNIIGDLLVISGTLRVFGTVRDVALVTVFSNGLSCLAALWLLLSERKTALFHIPKQAAMRDILRLGIPAAGESCSYKCSQLVVTMMLGHLGSQVLAAKIYGMNLSRILVLLPNSIAIAAGIMVGVSAGENNWEQAGKTAFSCIKKGALAIAFTDLLLLFGGRFLLSQFTKQPEILNMAYMVFLMEAVTMFLKNVNLTLGNSLRAIKDVLYPVLISVFSMWLIGTGLAWVLGIALPFGLVGIFCAFFVDEGVRALLLLRRWQKKIQQLTLKIRLTISGF